jgi:surfeit locus 1 family protein
MCLGVALTVRLGFWQLSRAQEKQDRHAAIEAQWMAPVLDTRSLLQQPDQFNSLHRRVVLQGVWRPEHTLYLDNRPMNGRAGFWVLTPLALDADHVVLVQRGWIPRHQLDRTLLPSIETPLGVVQIHGRIALPPSDLMQLGASDAPTVSASGTNNIRQNLDFTQYAKTVNGKMMAVVLQTDPASEGLLRDWPEITAGVEKHLAYAFQWFALAAMQLLLYCWFQWIKPYRYVRNSTS